MTVLLRGLLRLVLRCVDFVYHWRHHSEAVGPLLLVNASVHDGPDKEFADGTLIRHGDTIGAIHFDNRVTAKFTSRSARAAAIQLLRVLMQSLEVLAQKSVDDPEYARFKVYRGITWLPSHGATVGFETEPLAEGRRRRFLTRFFRVLVWAVAPSAETRTSAHVEPIVFWMTRTQLLTRRYGRGGRSAAGH